MNNKGTAGIVIGVVVGWVCLTAVFNGLFNVKKGEDGKVEKITVNEQTKTNGQIIWCKMQGKTNCDK